jgi:nucleotide-binding universal stress UspA family protein
MHVMEGVMAHLRSRVPLIVVGIDGSDRSAPVLRWAARQAAAVRGRLDVVMAWRLPELPGGVPMRFEARLDEEAEKRVHELITEALDALDIRAGELQIETTVQEGGPVRILLRQAREADLLVLGSRGHGPDANKLLGSVTASCLVQAKCPVVIVPVDEPASS